jgi:excisionase family DNA binding protein
VSVAELQLLTVEEVATALKQSVSTIRQKVYRGELDAVRLGECGPLRIPADELERHLRPAGRAKTAEVEASAVSAPLAPERRRAAQGASFRAAGGADLPQRNGHL